MGFALITGSSRGIGAAIAKMLASDGFDIAINYVSNSAAAEKVAEECHAFGVKAEIFRADVSSFEECSDMIAAACEKLGTPSVLVNNAGINRDSLLVRMSEAQFDEVLSKNLKSCFNMCRLIAPIMMKARSGRIINISSVAGIAGNAGQVNYAASKAAIIGLTKSAAKELGGRGITVNAIAPGFTSTDMTESLPDKVRDEAIASISLRRFASPEDIAGAAAFLASDRAAYITGQVLVVDGGMRL